MRVGCCGNRGLTHSETGRGPCERLRATEPPTQARISGEGRGLAHALSAQPLPLTELDPPTYGLSPPLMAPLLTLFLVALVGLPLAQALDCHVCAYNGDNCFNPMRCPSMVRYCMTTRTYYTPYRMKVSKSCVPSCFETVYDGYSKHASTTSCCQYDLCNGAGLTAPETLALALVLLATIWGLI